jgi:uncharacterized protein YfiM (DUF2279 family)
MHMNDKGRLYAAMLAALLVLAAPVECLAQEAAEYPHLFALSRLLPASPASETQLHTVSPIIVETSISDTLTIDDPWLAFDKVQHFTFSFLFTLGSQYMFVNKADVSEGSALPVSIAVSGVLGVSKELYDYHVGPTRYFSKRDLVVDALGILTAAGLIAL